MPIIAGQMVILIKVKVVAGYTIKYTVHIGYIYNLELNHRSATTLIILFTLLSLNNASIYAGHSHMQLHIVDLRNDLNVYVTNNFYNNY